MVFFLNEYILAKGCPDMHVHWVLGANTIPSMSILSRLACYIDGIMLINREYIGMDLHTLRRSRDGGSILGPLCLVYVAATRWMEHAYL
jgi:hypothetical protein